MKHTPIISMSLAWLLVGACAWVCRDYTESTYKGGMIDPVQVYDTVPVIKHTKVVDMKSVYYMQYLVKQAIKYDHLYFMAKDPVLMAQMQDSTVKYRTAIYNENKRNYGKGN